MKHHLAFTLLLLTITLWTNCTSKQENKALETSQETTAPQALNTDSLIQVINQKRIEIENNLGEPIAVNTSTLREKIKQKWEKIHFYTKDNQIVRIKTYPYAKISSRTEEFYLENATLIMAVIEDKGDGSKGKSIDQLDKVYYFHDNTPIFEKHKDTEGEYSLRNSDAEELMTEVKEYLDIYQNQQKK